MNWRMKKGTAFTLVESMVAVTILTIAVAGPLLTASRAIVSARIARDQLTASYLAQKGVEYVRSVRDDAYLAAYQAGGSDVSSAAWASFLNSCTGSACVPALISGSFPEFSRSVEVLSISGTDARVTSRVSWSFHEVPYSVTVTDHLTSWQ